MICRRFPVRKRSVPTTACGKILAGGATDTMVAGRWVSVHFHAQQLAEKALKGLLTWYDQPSRKTHNLVEIGQQCGAIDATLEDLTCRAARLTEYAWKFRYPGEPAEPPVEEKRRKH